MTGLFFRSLRARLIIAAAIGIAIGIYAAGIFIDELFRHFATSLVENELRTDMEELVTLIDVDAAGFPHLARPLSDPRFGQDGSGFVWQVSRGSKSLIKSLSAATAELPSDANAPVTNEPRKLTLEGPRGPMIVYERLFQPEEGAQPLRIQIGADLAVIDEMAPTFNRPLTGSLVLLALALVGAAILQVSFGLRPMSRLRRALGAVGAGKAEKLPSDFPSEVQPLVDDLNNLMEINSQILMRARAQAGNLAHGLKTPLAVLIDEADRLKRRGEQESADVILQQSQRMQRQIDYQIARARAAASRSVPGVLAAVGPVLSNILSAMTRLYESKNLQIDADVDPECVTLCDPMDLNEMLANLMDNACKWAANVVAVRGFVDRINAQVVIEIEDDGPGLPAEALDRVFKIGERLDDQVPGSGLGLPIVRDLTHLYGGRIDLDRSVRGGLRATLKLPAAPRLD
ncbi:MAG TPA: HAMP domain-containing sensor histidine kinase [Xanthobacteraceae bacterium]